MPVYRALCSHDYNENRNNTIKYTFYIMLPIIEDCFFAAIAAVGFGSISNIPTRAFYGCAFLAAAGHGTRTLLMGMSCISIIWASLAGSIVIGLLSIPVSSHLKTPAESMSYPALLPMIPGMYAYRTINALLQCTEPSPDNILIHNLCTMSYNGLVCTIIILLMLIGVTIPIFFFDKYSFSATR